MVNGSKCMQGHGPWSSHCRPSPSSSPLLCPNLRLEYRDMSMGSVSLLNPKALIIHKLLPRTPAWYVSFPPTGQLSRITWLWPGLFFFRKQTCTFRELRVFNHPSVNTESQTKILRARKNPLPLGRQATLLGIVMLQNPQIHTLFHRPHMHSHTS